MTARKFFVGGNWKMNGSTADCHKWIEGLNSCDFDSNPVDVVVAPPSIYLGQVVQKIKSLIKVSAQNCYLKESGAFTGEISPQMLKDVGVNWVILGHSERRAIFQESSQFVAEKVAFALASGLKVIFCIGETLEQRESGQTLTVLHEQLNALKATVKDLANVVIAYEPVWAIGTGKVATTQQAQEAHVGVREWIKQNYSQEVANKTRIIYGGSVNEKNCAELALEKDVDGFLVGGASLKPEFNKIIMSYQKKQA